MILIINFLENEMRISHFSYSITYVVLDRKYFVYYFFCFCKPLLCLRIATWKELLQRSELITYYNTF